MSDRLTTRIGDLHLVNPVICGSGEPVMTEAGIRAALDAGAAGVIAKSLNERAEAAAQLDRADYAFLDAAGAPAMTGLSLLNRSGLIQRDIADWLAAVATLDRQAAQDGRFVAASVVLAGMESAVAIARQARQAGLRVFELNVGAPHAAEAAPGVIVQESDPARLRSLIAEVRAATTGMQLWVKLTGLAGNLPALALAASDAGADAVCMMGRFMAMVPDLDTFAPVLGSAAAYGGGWALPIVCRFLALSRHAVPAGYPLIGTNGVRTGEDVARMMLAGAAAVEVLSVVMHEGFAALTRIIDQLAQYLHGRELRDGRELRALDLVGRAADQMAAYNALSPLPGRWRAFVPDDTHRL